MTERRDPDLHLAGLLTQTEAFELIKRANERGRMAGRSEEREAWAKDIEAVFGGRAITIHELDARFAELAARVRARIERDSG